MKLILLVFFLVLNADTVFGGAPGNTRDFERKLERANLYYSNGNYQAALKMYLELYKSDSSNCNLCYKIGVCYLKTDRRGQEALPFFQKAVESTASDYSPEDRAEKRAPV